MNVLGYALVDLAIISAFLIVVIAVDIGFDVGRRRRAGLDGLTLQDFVKRRSALLFLPIAAIVALQQALFSAHGFQTRDDVPYVLGLFAVMATLVWLLARWAKRQP